MSENVNLADFLREKFDNMARWLVEEVGQEELSSDVLEDMAARSNMQVVLFASHIRQNKALVDARNFVGLRELAGSLPTLQKLIDEIDVRVDLHAKFWRYMDLFAKFG